MATNLRINDASTYEVDADAVQVEQSLVTVGPSGVVKLALVGGGVLLLCPSACSTIVIVDPSLQEQPVIDPPTNLD
jgi:hypothetical protein